MARRIAFVSYETPFAPAGGVAAVLARLPAHVQHRSGIETVVITPYHHRIRGTADLGGLVPVGTLAVPYQHESIDCALLRYDGPAPAQAPRGHAWYFVRPTDARFFAGHPHPYLAGGTRLEMTDTLRRDSLLFGAATARALALIDPGAEWILFLQDWEAATTALALDEAARGRGKAFLTLHNSYDSGLTDHELARHGLFPWPGHTILDRVLPLVEAPVFTVSRQFALDLVSDPCQTELLANHLQAQLSGRLVGVDNGPFVPLAVDRDRIHRALRGDSAPLEGWKAERRRQALKALAEFSPTRSEPVWGDRERFDGDEAACWFVMAGRDDPRQKGYDVAAAAVRRHLAGGGEGRFLFFPIPGDEGLGGLSFLESLARDFPAKVLAFPFRWTAGYAASLQGAAFGLMPSLYEPFGMANEFYLQGTMGIGRATGGIVQQIVPLRGVASFSPSAQALAARWHPPPAPPTGLLFREPYGLPSSLGDWRVLNDAAYDPAVPDARLGQRAGIRLFQAMSGELERALVDAWRLFQEPKRYCRMLAEGIGHIERTFSWERAAEEYLLAAGLTARRNGSGA